MLTATQRAHIIRTSVLLAFLFSACACPIAWSYELADDPSQGIRVRGPGVAPNLAFACCEHGIEQMQSELADAGVIDALRALHAEVAIPIVDFSRERAAAVHRLNQAGIPVIAWMLLSNHAGNFLTADNAPEAAERVSAFEAWTKENGLKWAAVGLDIEPNFAELSALRGHWTRLIATLFERSFDGKRVRQAQQAYATLIREIQAQGDPVETYQMPYLPAERSVHSDLPDRLLGTVDVRGNLEYLMLYTSSARMAGAGMIWSLGRNAQAIAIGNTDGDTAAGTGSGPLDWDEFSRDLIVASHYSNQIGVYDLEGCIRQGFLTRLQNFDWSQSVIIPAASVHRAERLGLIVRIALWTGSHLLYLIAAFLLLIAFMVRWRIHRKRRTALP